MKEEEDGTSVRKIEEIDDDMQVSCFYNIWQYR
jgi:hypothetical protein